MATADRQDAAQITPSRSTLKVWDLPVRLFHWTLALSIAVSFLSAEEDSIIGDWHMPAGWFAAALIAFRVVWGVVGGEHARFAAFIKPGAIGAHLADLFSGRAKPHLGHNPLGGLAIVALLLLPLLVIFTGVQLYQGGGEEDLHEAIAYTLLALIVFHIVAVIVTSLLTRENLVGAFLTGRKRADRHPGAVDAAPPMPIAVPAAAVAAGASAFLALQVDSTAFTPKPREHAEAGERGENAGQYRGEREEHERENDERD